MESVSNEHRDSKRLVLGFDAGCLTCSELAQQIEEQVGTTVEVRSLYEPQVEEWRKQALGNDAPWAPTLIEVNNRNVKAWTGLRMGIRLSSALGPVTTWRVMEALGDYKNSNTPKNDTFGSTGGISRGKFLKGLGGGLIAATLLSGTGTLSAATAATQSSQAFRPSNANKKDAMDVVLNSEEYKRYARRLERKGRKIKVDEPAIARIPKNNQATPAYVEKAGQRYDVREGWHVVFLGAHREGERSMENRGSLLTFYVNVTLGTVGTASLQNYRRLSSGNVRIVTTDLLGTKVVTVGTPKGKVLRRRVLRSGQSSDEQLWNNLEFAGYTEEKTEAIFQSAQRCGRGCQCYLCGLIGAAGCAQICIALTLGGFVAGSIACSLFCAAGAPAICIGCGG